MWVVILLCESLDSPHRQTFYSALRQTFSSLETILSHWVLHSFLPAFVSLSIRSDVLGTWHVILKGAVPFRTLSVLFQGDEAVYYYSAEVILDVTCAHAKNNAPTMPRITHGHCSTRCLCTPPARGNWAHTHPPRLLALTSIIAVNVRICLCLCNSLMCTQTASFVCIICGWIGLKGQFQKTGWGLPRENNRMEGEMCHVLADCSESFKKFSHVITLTLIRSVFCVISIYCDEVWQRWYKVFFWF